MQTVRQGDILFIRQAKAPAKSAAVIDGVIARGTATGHAHTLRPSPRARLVRANGKLYVVAKSMAHVDHDEHATVTLATGTWEVRRQREKTPEGFSQVED